MRGGLKVVLLGVWAVEKVVVGRFRGAWASAEWM